MVEESPLLQWFNLETTTRCNLQCIHCAANEENNLGDYDARDLPMELFYKILPILQEFQPMVGLSGHGETLLHPNFMEMLEKVIQTGSRVSFHTNGMLLTPQKIEKIVHAGVEHIGISIDAATPELFERIRRRAHLDKILQNIRLINETKKRLRTDRPQLTFEFVAMRQNIHELPSVIRMAGELEVVKFTVAELVEYNLTRGQSLANDPLMAEWVSEAEAEARKWGICLRLPPHIPRKGISGSATNSIPTYKGFRKTCKEPWHNMWFFLQSGGQIQPCCVIHESYGDPCVQGFKEVWFGPKYEALRKALLTDEPFAVCVHCHLYGWEPIASHHSYLSKIFFPVGSKRRRIAKFVRKILN